MLPDLTQLTSMASIVYPMDLFQRIADSSNPVLGGQDPSMLSASQVIDRLNWEKQHRDWKEELLPFVVERGEGGTKLVRDEKQIVSHA